MVKDLTEGSPRKVLWLFSLPLLGSIVFQQLYNIADSFVAGKFIGDNALAAVGNAYEVTLIYLAFTFGCNIGTSVIVSQLFGAKRFRDLKTAVSTCFISSSVICALLMLLGYTLSPTLLHIIHVPEEIFSDVIGYLYIYTGGLFFQFLYNISTGIFSALGDSKTPFWFLAFSSVSNIFVDIVFVKMGFGIHGIAWATFLCQGISCILAFATVLRRLSKLEHKDAEHKTPIFSKNLLAKFLKVAIPSILQQSFVSVGNMFIQSLVNNFSTAVIAGYSAVIKLQNLSITCISTLGTAMSNYTAQNLGAGKPERVKQGYRAGLGMGAAVSLLLTAVYMLFGSTLVGIFRGEDSSPEVIEVGLMFIRVVAPFYIVVMAKLISDGVLRGAGAMNHYMAATFTDLLLRVILAFAFTAAFSHLNIALPRPEMAIWLAWPIGWLIATVMSVAFYLSGVWKKTLL